MVWRSDNGMSWKEHTDLGTIDVVQKAVCGSFDGWCWLVEEWVEWLGCEWLELGGKRDGVYTKKY